MNRKQIIDELRRSAMENADPWKDCKWGAIARAEKWRSSSDRSLTCFASHDHTRTFYLLVACALEDEQ